MYNDKKNGKIGIIHKIKNYLKHKDRKPKC